MNDTPLESSEEQDQEKDVEVTAEEKQTAETLPGAVEDTASQGLSGTAEDSETPVDVEGVVPGEKTESSEEPDESDERSFGEKLLETIDVLPDGSITLAEIRDLIGHEGLLLFTIFLNLIFLVPVSVPGVSTVFGAAILLVGFFRFFNLPFWLPTFIAARTLPSDKLRGALQKSSVWIHRLEKISRPHRLSWFTRGGIIALSNNGALILGAVLLMMPFGLVPFSNTLPALACILLAVGMLHRDGVCIFLGHLTNLLTIIYFAILIYLLFSAGNLALSSFLKG
ncbi:MAG: exopolysaccharide biosynthesis protein [Candidatus Hydrogenedens sp.]|nr:exopolysaccharide biosynthesis protein [Candidatus Hydrogenedens sp.]